MVVLRIRIRRSCCRTFCLLMGKFFHICGIHILLAASSLREDTIARFIIKRLAVACLLKGEGDELCVFNCIALEFAAIQ